MTSRIISSNIYERCFQDEILTNALFVNKNFSQSHHHALSVKKEAETVFHLYFSRANVRYLYNYLKLYIMEDLTLPS